MLELVIIVSGITLSFALDGWWQSRLGQECLMGDLGAIQISMESDRSELLYLIEDRELCVPAIHRLTDYAVGGEKPGSPPELFLSMSRAGASFFRTPVHGNPWLPPATCAGSEMTL